MNRLLAAIVVFVGAFVRAAEPADVISQDALRFAALLDSRVPELRVEGIKGLSHLKHWAAEPALVRLLDDRAFEVRKEALQALCRVGTSKCIPNLIATLRDPSWEMRDSAALGLQRMSAQEFPGTQPLQWEHWWSDTSLEAKRRELFAVVSATHTNAQMRVAPATVLRAGKRVPIRSSSAAPASCAERRQALRALRHLATASDEARLIELLAKPQTPPLDLDERAFICEALERVGTSGAVAILATQHSEAAAWALGRIGGASAERALLQFPPSLATLLALDRLHCTNTAASIPFLVSQMAQITYRSHPDDVMNDELQPIQRVGVNLISRSGLAPVFIECVLQELENTMKPSVAHGVRPAHPSAWTDMFQRMRSELKPGFVREDGVTTSQPIVAMCYLTGSYEAALAQRLVPLLNHPAIVPRVYVALALGRMHAKEALPALTRMIEDGYPFSDSTALASGKHFEHSQTVRWRGFLCMALGRMGGDEARVALERYASTATQPRDIRYSSVVGLRFIGSPKSLAALGQVAANDVIWMVRDEASRAAETIRLLSQTQVARQ